MLTCQQLTELVTDYLEGRLPLMQRLRMQFHLGMCSRCRAYLRQMKMTIRTLGALPPEPMPVGVRDELLERFRSMRPVGLAPAPRSRIAEWNRWLGVRGWVVVGVLLAVAAALRLLVPGRPGPVLGEAWACLVIQFGAALLPVGLGMLLAARAHQRFIASSFAALATAGGFVCYLSMPLWCPYCHMHAHALVVHVGVMALGALLGAAMPHLTMQRAAAR